MPKPKKTDHPPVRPFRAWFQCSEGCDQKYPLNEVVYQCRSCGGLLDVRHDVEALKQHDAEHWKALWTRRWMKTSWPYGSGVWGKKEWVCPNVENDNLISLYEGGSNLFWADRLGRELGLSDLWIKQCGNSHTGSFKDLGMTVLVSMVNQMIREGQGIRGVACASTGDTSAALAAYCAVAGIPSIVFLPKGKITDAQLIQPISNGSITVSLDTDFDGCMAIVKRFTAENGIYLANSMNSLRIEGQKTVSLELVQQFDWEVPDWVIIPGGNLGNVTALGRGFLMLKSMGIIRKLPRICVAQAAKANPLYLSFTKAFREFHAVHARTTAASAIQIGHPVSWKRAIRTLKEFDGVVEQATEDELADACARADRTGLFTCPHTGVALAALFKLAGRKLLRKKDRVIVISTAHGLKFTTFKANYQAGRLPGVKPKRLNPPIELPNRYEAVRDRILREIERAGVSRF